MTSILGDVRDREKLEAAFRAAQPEIVFHLAAQPIVLDSYRDPAYTYETNVMGTVNILECVRRSHCVRSFLNVTTDKVYQNREWVWGYREDEPLDGFDPYSNSKSCSELVTHSYSNSFFRSPSPRPGRGTSSAAGTTRTTASSPIASGRPGRRKPSSCAIPGPSGLTSTSWSRCSLI